MSYKKIDKLNRLKNLGLNVFDFRICEDEQGLINAITEFNYKCTVRSDCDTRIIKDGWLFPFYIVKDGQSINSINYKLLNQGYKFIVANGLRYDKYLRLNVCLKINRNGEFICEYSRLKLPLRSMYNHPRDLTCIYGNLDEKIVYWKVINSTGIDLREIRDILRSEYLNCEHNNLFGKYIELSTYTVNCGVYNKDKIYWEI